MNLTREQLREIKMRQIGWLHTEEDYSPFELSQIFKLSTLTVTIAINDYKKEFQDVQV